MIDENFLQNAVRIRRTYLKMINNMDFYQNKAKEIVDRLDETIEKVNIIQQRAEESKKNNETGSQDLLNELMKILNDIEDEGHSLENLVDPLNSDIEKLALEEQELYRLIKQKHNNLTDEQIIESVKDRLIKENLS
jgi:flagellar hook-basal body complex protein FliE